MPFLLDGNPTTSEISDAVNYILSNFSQSVTADPNTGQVIGPGGEVQSYLYKYMFVRYADSFDGTVNFSDLPTNKAYYGLRNSDSSTESTNPADYIWYKATPPAFGTTYFLYYLTTGGRSIQFQIATAVPNPGWVVDPGTAIDLDFVTGASNSPANFVVIRVANNSAAPSDAEVLSAIGRLPISGDLCTVNYNSGLYSLTFKYTTGWAIFQKYITGDLIVAQSIVASNIAANTITAGQIAANTITAGQIAANTITADRLSVSQLSAINANLGTITAGSLNAVNITGSDLSIGSSPAISGTTMTGSGSHLYNDGRFAMGNSTRNMTFDGTTLTLNGMGSATLGGLSSSVQMPLSPTGIDGFIDSFSITKTGYINLFVVGEVLFVSNSLLYPGVYAPVTISLRSGNTLPGTATGVFDTFNIRMMAPVFVPGLGGPATNRLQVPLNWSRVINLSPGTYLVYICADAGFYDNAGTLQYTVPLADKLFNGRINVLQPTI